MRAVTDETFDDAVLASEQPVLVDFWAPWCRTCLRMMPVVEKFAAEAPTWDVVSVNVEDSPETAARFKVLSLPTLIAFQNGTPVARKTGAVKQQELLSLLDE
jgi:thioredoxin 1